MAEAARILVVFAHPAVERARINPSLLDAAAAVPGVAIRDLYELYPDFTVDVGAEQAALAEARLVVLQFPLYWFAAPALLKEWTDQVLTRGFAYGPGGAALAGKGLLCAVSTGADEAGFRPRGPFGARVEAYLAPFQQTARVCGMDWLDPFVVHAAAVAGDGELAAAAARYRARLQGLATQAGR